MSLLKFITELLGAKPMSASATVVLQSGYDADKPIQRDKDQQLTTETFLFELTVTSNAALQALNRLISDTLLQKLVKLARFRDLISEIFGVKARVHSGYRSPDLNGATKGASKTSQHMKAEALDFDIPGLTIDEVFAKLRAEAAAGRFQFGQLIIEEADRGYKNADGTESIARWVHASQIGTLDPAHVGQVMRAKWNEAEKKFDYELVEVVKFDHPNPLT